MNNFYFFARSERFPAWLCLRALGTGFVALVEIAFTSIVVFGVLVSFPTTGFAQPGGFRANTISYNVSGYLWNSGTGYKNFSGSDFVQNSSNSTDPSSVPDPATLKATVADTHGSGGAMSNASVTVEALADFGSLRVDLHGYLSRVSTATSQIGEAFLQDARVQARWQDTLSLANSVDPRPGRLHHIEAELRLDGGMIIEAEGTPVHNSNRFAASNVHLKLSGNSPILGDALPPPPYGGFFGEAADSTDPAFSSYMRPTPQKIPVNIWAREDELFTMDFLLEASAGGAARINSYYAAFGNSFSTTFSANYGHTLSWGGITSVTDAVTGEPIEGWTITSASGIDYAHAIVPESASVVLALSGLLGLECLRIVTVATGVGGANLRKH